LIQSNPSEEILVIGTAAGFMKLVDVKKNKISLKIEISSS